MKKVLLALFLLSSTIGFAQEFKFEEETIDYGKILVGSDGKRVFKFTNIGDKPLIIEKVPSTCGCTVPKKPEKPIMPGEKGEIEVSYNTKIAGRFHKTITIFSNAKEKIKPIHVKGHVVKEALPVKEKSMLSNQ